jgi:hypothetical protein
MLHLGHFSFDELDFKNKPRHGYFSCVVEAAGAEQAVKKIKAHLVDMKQNNMAFSTIVNVYLQDIIQIESVPREPVITRLQSSRGEFPKSISYTLPSGDIGGIEAFGLTPNVQMHEKNKTDAYMESEPFLTF